MNGINQLITDIAMEAAVAAPAAAGDYYDEEGLLRCGVCGERKQYVLPGELFGGTKVACLCRCTLDRVTREGEEEKKKLEAERTAARKRNCFQHRKQWHLTFENDDGRQAKMKIMLSYAEHWNEMREKNIGLLLTGSIGSGKSFAAACIANRLCETGTGVKMLNLSEALNGIYSAYDKNGYIRELTEYPLLIIDDFALERSSEYSLENTFNLIDNRYRSGKPLIITTNLSMGDMHGSSNALAQRICDRLAEMCVPISFIGPSNRRSRGEEKAGLLAECLNAGN